MPRREREQRRGIGPGAAFEVDRFRFKKTANQLQDSVGRPLEIRFSVICTSAGDFVEDNPATNEANSASKPYIPAYAFPAAEVSRLEFKMLHPVVHREGDLYIARADFFDDEGRPVNMRFFIVMRENRPHTLQAVAHTMGSETLPSCVDAS